MAGCNTKRKVKKMEAGGMTKEPSKRTAERMEAATKAGLKNPLGSSVAKMLDKATSGDTASGKKQYDKFYDEAKKAKKMESERKTKKMKDGGKVMKKMNPGMAKLKKAAPEVAKKMGYKKGGMACGTKTKKMKSGGMVKRADGCVTKGRTRGRMV